MRLARAFPVALVLLGTQPLWAAEFGWIDLTFAAAAGGFQKATFTDLNDRGALAGYSSYSDGSTGTIYAPGFFVWKGGALSSVRVNSEATQGSANIVVDINNAGQVVGTGIVAVHTGFQVEQQQRSFVWGASGVTWLDGQAGSTRSDPVGLNDAGHVAASGTAGTVWKPGVGWVSTPGFTATGSAFRIDGNAINNGGQIVGVAGGSAAVWKDGQVSVLPKLNAQFTGTALSVNNAGQLAGFNDGSIRQGVLWRDGGIVALGDLTYSRFPISSEARDLNDRGHVVGQASALVGSGYEPRAFLWRNGYMEDLNALVAPLPQGFALTAASSINNRGQMIAEATGTDGEIRSFLLNPLADARTAIRVDDGGGTPFGGRVVLASPERAVGLVVGASGSFTLTRGGRLIGSYGPNDRPPLYIDDLIETGDGSSARLRFDDNSTLDVAGRSKVLIDSFVYDGSAQGPAEYDMLRELFIHASDWVDKGEPIVPTRPPGFGGGIRGDAADYMNPDDLDVSVKMNVGSPVTLYTVVDLPSQAFDLSFEAVFLTATGTLQLALDDFVVGSFAAQADRVGRLQTFTLRLDDADLLALGQARLAFTFDGPSGSQMLVDNIVMPGVLNGHFTEGDGAWFHEGPGTLDLVATISEERWAQITTPVPEPRAMTLMVLGLGAVAMLARRRRPGRPDQG